MVNNESAPTHADVPEELYNLTQLADVTLAAGKLSTDRHSSSGDHLTGLVPVRQSTYSVAVYAGADANGANRAHRNVCSSSDDDTYGSSGLSFTKNYAHKIFDKRKARQQLLSTYVTPPSTSCSPANSPDTTGAFSSSSSAHSSENEASKSQNLHVAQVVAPSSSGERDDARLSLSGGSEHTVDCESAFADDDAYGMADDDDDDDDEGGDPVDGTEGDDTDIHVCPECGKKYSTSSNLARHRQTHRSLMDKKARRCPHCDKVYVSMPAFSMHVRTHNQGCECPHCGKRFSRPWLLQGHIRTHTGEKPFECSICSKAFADKSNLRAHIQTHSNTKPHTCTRCGKSFALKSYLYKHEESSCVRNINKTSNKRSASESSQLSDKCKSTRRSDSSSSSSPIYSMVDKFARNDSGLMKSTKRGKSSSELQRKCREKLRNKLNRPISQERNAPGAECQPVLSPPTNVTTDWVSKKSYIELSKPLKNSTSETFSLGPNERSSLDIGNEFPRKKMTSANDSVMCAPNDQDNSMTNTPGLSMGFYQEIPMDFSPKATKNFSNNSGNTFGITSKYALIV